MMICGFCGGQWMLRHQLLSNYLIS